MDEILLGDSHLARVDKDGVAGLIPRLEKALPDLRLVNMARSGANTITGLELLKTEPVSGRADVALVMFGTNDAASWKEVPLEQYRANLHEMVSGLRDKTGSVILVTPPPVNVEKQAPPGRSNETLAVYSRVVVEEAKAVGVKYLDLFSLLSGIMKEKDIHIADGVHLNDAGYEVFFENLLPLLTKSV